MLIIMHGRCILLLQFLLPFSPGLLQFPVLRRGLGLWGLRRSWECGREVAGDCRYGVCLVLGMPKHLFQEAQVEPQIRSHPTGDSRCRPSAGCA